MNIINGNDNIAFPQEGIAISYSAVIIKLRNTRHYEKRKKFNGKGEKTMAEFKYIIKDEIGIHARPAGLLVKLVKSLDAAVQISKGEKTADAGKLMAVMGLAAKKGDEITVACDDEGALEKVKEFLENNL